MITVTIYELSSGQIRGVYSGPESSVDANVPDGCGYLIGSYSSLLYEVRDGVPEKKSPEVLAQNENQMAWDDLRSRRDYMLESTDWTQVQDAPVDHAAWATYRQALRDLPANTVDPRDPPWPIPPA
jgi:hypothetical protein